MKKLALVYQAKSNHLNYRVMDSFLKPGSTIAANLHPLKVFFLLILTGCFLYSSSAVGQCNFYNLNTSYGDTDGPVTLYEETAGGTWSGPGVSGDTFDPAVAGVGTHTVQYVNNDVYTVDTSGTFSPYTSASSWITVPNSAGGKLQDVDDDLSVAVNIGFTFNFFGVDYTQIYISSNGNVAFDSYAASFFSGTAIPAHQTPNNMIALVRTDLDPSNTVDDEIKYQVTGTGPNRIFVLSYNNVNRYGTNNEVTTQLKLFESTNNIEIHTTENSAVSETSLQGIENATGSRGHTVWGRNDEFWVATNDFVSFIPCTDSQVVTVYEHPVADAGSGGSICGKDSGNPFTFSAVSSAGTGIWTQRSGPGISTFGDANVSTTTVTVDTYGSYVYRWTEVNGAYSGYDEVTVVFDEQTVAESGPATAESCDLSILLSGIQSIPGSTAGWTVTTGNAPDITFSKSNIFNPTVTSTSYGTYTFTLAETNGACVDTDDILVTFTKQPMVDAGSGGSVCGKDSGNPFTFSAVSSAGTGIWTQRSGPGISTFGDANVSTTTVTVDTYGSYVYRWTEVNGGCSDYDEVTVIFYEPTVADAGSATAKESDLSFQLSGIQSIPGSIVNWSVTEGNPSDITFSKSNIFNPTVTSTSYDTYTFTLAETNGVCVDNDDVLVTFKIMDDNYTVSATAGANGSLDGATPSPQIVDHGESTTFTFNAAANHHLTSITGCGTNYINTSNGVTSHTVSTGPIKGNCTVSAAFGIDHYALSTTITGKGGGYVNIDATGEDCIDHCTGTYPHGTLITLTATAMQEHEFNGWGGDCEGVDDICTVVMDKYRSVTAGFTSEFSLILWYSSFAATFAHLDKEQDEDN